MVGKSSKSPRHNFPSTLSKETAMCYTDTCHLYFWQGDDSHGLQYAKYTSNSNCDILFTIIVLATCYCWFSGPGSRWPHISQLWRNQHQHAVIPVLITFCPCLKWKLIMSNYSAATSSQVWNPTRFSALAHHTDVASSCGQSCEMDGNIRQSHLCVCPQRFHSMDTAVWHTTAKQNEHRTPPYHGNLTHNFT